MLNKNKRKILMSKKCNKKIKNRLVRCMNCSHMFEITEANTYYLEDETEMYYCTNCGADKPKH